MSSSDQFPLLSVVIPIYNVEKYLDLALSSLQNQSFSNYEVILVDDCGSDNSIQVAKHYVSDPRFKIVQNPQNLGLADARNRGIKCAQGKYIFFFDSDDFLPQHFLKSVMSQFKQHKVDIVCFNRTDFCNEEEVRKLSNSEVIDFQRTDGSNLLRLLLQKKVETTAWSYIIKRELIEQNHLYFSSGRLFEDTDFTPALFACVKKAIILKLFPSGYGYRVGRADSIMGKTKHRKSDNELTDHLFMAQRKYQTYLSVFGEVKWVQQWYFNELCALLLDYRELLK